MFILGKYLGYRYSTSFKNLKQVKARALDLRLETIIGTDKNMNRLHKPNCTLPRKRLTTGFVIFDLKAQNVTSGHSLQFEYLITRQMTRCEEDAC